MDIGWTPKRPNNATAARGVRQGSQHALQHQYLLHYIANNPWDGSRLDMVQGKAELDQRTLLRGAEAGTPTRRAVHAQPGGCWCSSAWVEEVQLRLEAAEEAGERRRKVKVAPKASPPRTAAVPSSIPLRACPHRAESDDRSRVSVGRTAKLAGPSQRFNRMISGPWATWAKEAEHHAMLVPKREAPCTRAFAWRCPARPLGRGAGSGLSSGRIGPLQRIGRRRLRALGFDLARKGQWRSHLEPGMRVAAGSGGPSRGPRVSRAGIDAAMQAKWLSSPRGRAGGAWEALSWTQAPSRFVEEAVGALGGDEVVRARWRRSGTGQKLG
jgi:hypothetical protein